MDWKEFTNIGSHLDKKNDRERKTLKVKGIDSLGKELNSGSLKITVGFDSFDSRKSETKEHSAHTENKKLIFPANEPEFNLYTTQQGKVSLNEVLEGCYGAPSGGNLQIL